MLTVDFIESIVNQMTPTIEIESVVDNGDGTQTLTVCKTYWMRKHMVVTIDGSEYKISSFVKDESITIPDSPAVTASEFTLQAPYYFHGTPMQVNNEWSIRKVDND